MEGLDKGLDSGKVVHQKRPIVTPLCNALWTAQIEVNIVTLTAIHMARSTLQYGWIVCAELDKEGPVFWAGCEVLCAICGGLGEQPCMHHGGVGRRGAKFPAKQPEGKLRLQKRGISDLFS